MTPILLFNNRTWTREQVELLLQEREIAFQLRFGFNNILAICNESIDFRASPSANPYLCVWHDALNHLVSNKCILVDQNGPKARDTQELLESWAEIKFDLTNFGFLPEPTEDKAAAFEALKFIVKAVDGTSVEMSLVPEAKPVLDRADLLPDVKRLIIDFVALYSTSSLVATKLHGRDTLTQYATLFVLSFVTRAEIEKLMLLVAAIDPVMDLSKLDGSKRIRRVFQTEAAKSDWDIAKTLARFVTNVSLLDDNYRSPEVHKRGRLLALVHAGHFDSLINEVYSFHNEAQHIFRDICKSMIQRETPAKPSA